MFMQHIMTYIWQKNCMGNRSRTWVIAEQPNQDTQGEQKQGDLLKRKHAIGYEEKLHFKMWLNNLQNLV